VTGTGSTVASGQLQAKSDVREFGNVSIGQHSTTPIVLSQSRNSSRNAQSRLRPPPGKENGSGECSRSVVIVTEPDALPAAVGANTALRVRFGPKDSM